MTCLTGQAEAALMRLYEQASHSTDNFTLERIDRALDEILRLNGTEPPVRQVRSAMAHAYQVIRDRRRTVVPETLEAREIEPPNSGMDEDVIDLQEWLRSTPRVTGQQRNLLGLLANDPDAADLAAMYHVSVLRMREQISRTRRAARIAYRNEMNMV